MCLGDATPNARQRIWSKSNDPASPPPPINPDVRRRKLAALARRSQTSTAYKVVQKVAAKPKEQKIAAKTKVAAKPKEQKVAAKPKVADKPKEQKVADKPKKAPKGGDTIVSHPILSISNNRLELCAFDENWVKLYIFGSISRLYGPKLKEHGEHLKHYIESMPNVTKNQVLGVLRGLQGKRDGNDVS